MKNTLNKLLILSVFLTVTAGASALSLNEINLSNEVVTNGNLAQAETTIDTDTSIDANLDLSSSTDTSSSSSTESTTINQTTSYDDTTADITLTRAQVSEDNFFTSSITTPAMVSTHTDLELYSRNIMNNDLRVEEIGLTSGNVAVHYPAQVKLVGLIPYSTTAVASVDADGVVDVDYPWYSILSTSQKSALEEQIQIATDQVLQDASASGTTVYTEANIKARLLDAIYLVMKNSYEASVTADTQ